MPSRSIDPLDCQAARKLALKYIARRDYSSSQLRLKLVEKYGYDSATATTVVEELQAQNILNEERYIENFISYQISRGQGPARIRGKLRSVGIGSEAIERGLEGTDWVARACEIRRNKFGDPLPWDYANKKRQFRYLQSRGFTGAQIREVLT